MTNAIYALVVTILSLFASCAASGVKAQTSPQFRLLENDETRAADSKVTVSPIPLELDSSNYNQQINRNEVVKRLIFEIWQEKCSMTSPPDYYAGIRVPAGMPRTLDGELVSCKETRRKNKFSGDYLIIHPKIPLGAHRLFSTTSLRVLKCFDVPGKLEPGVWPCNSLGRPI